MYSVDGIALHNPGMGWKLLAASRPLTDHSVERTSLRVPGRPGVIADVDDRLASLLPPVPSFVVQTPRSKYETLLSLFMDGEVLGLTENDAIAAAIEYLSSSPVGQGRRDEIVQVTATLRIPGVFWRDVDERTFTQPITAASHEVDLWQMRGLVSDAVIRARGPFTNLVVASRRASLRLGNLTTAGHYLRYHLDTGRAYITSTDTWVGGTPASGGVQSIGPGGRFGIYPTKTGPLEPKRGRVTVTTATRGASTQLEIRGRGAHLAF